MEARPSGKNVRRLSLLSGGERSLTALAFLFGVFRARPSPFYLMDEVEAALDDVNLHRFLDLVHEFRDEAQLLVVSHQKRTMEAADCLYGVSMPPGGSSRVVSQRMQRRPAGGLTSRDVRDRAVLAASVNDPGLVNACGPKGEQSWLCSTVYRITGDSHAADVADALAKPIRIVVILLVAWIVGADHPRAHRPVGEAPERWCREAGVDRAAESSFVDTGPMPQARRTQRAETIGAVLRSIITIVIWSIAVLTILETLGINLAPLHRGRGHRRASRSAFGAQSLVRDFLSGCSCSWRTSSASATSSTPVWRRAPSKG